MIEIIKKGLESPRDILPYVFAKMLSVSTLERIADFQSTAIEADGFTTFREGGFAGGAQNRSQFAGKNYYEISQIQTILENIDIKIDNSLEIGAGYGRLSPWIAEFSTTHLGVDPNKEAISKAKEQYPNLHFQEGMIQEFPTNKGPFDLIVTWTVLQHIPPESIEDAIATIQSISSNPCYILVCEETHPKAANEHTWPRSPDKYDDLFDQQLLVKVQRRVLEPTYDHHGGKVMLFRQN